MKRSAFLGVMLTLLAPTSGVAKTALPTAAAQALAYAPLPSRSFVVPVPDAQAALAAIPAGQATALSAQTPRLIASETLTLIRHLRISPPRAARLLALTLSAVNDTAQAAAQAARPVQTDIAAFSAAYQVLRHLYPDAGISLQDDMQHQLAQLPAGRAQATAALANTVATRIITFADQDGAEQQTRNAVPRGDGLWQPLTGQNALEPGWGNVQPIGYTSQTLPKVAPPPAWNSDTFKQDRQNFKTVQQNLSAQDIQLGNYWAAGPGTVTPGGMWIETALNLAQQASLNGPDTATLLATTAVAEHDAFITCWHAKFTYNTERPQTWMNAAFPGWTPNIATPPFPSYPSGHATVSGAAARILAAAFQGQAAQLQKDAEAAAYSRVVGGIHWTVDGTGGLDAGNRVALGLLGLN